MIAQAAAGLALAAAYVFVRPPEAVVRQLARRLPEILFRADVDEPVVALSFDDGPHPDTTERVLDTLARHDARATFFVVGEACERHPELARRIVEAGHELGNHTWTVTRSASLAPEELAASIGRTQAALERFGRVTLMRPGSGWAPPRVREAARAHGLRPVLGSVYPYDPQIRWRRYTVWDVLRRIRPGGIIILHEGPGRGRVEAVLEEVLPELRRRGLRVVSVTELLDAAGGEFERAAS